MTKLSPIIANALLIVATANIIPPPEPTVERPDPDRIIVHDADYATITPWTEVYAIQQGIEFGYGHVWEDGSIVYWVNPEVDYHIIMYSPDDPDTDEIDRVVTEADVPVSTENRLDWLLYNRIIWEQKYNNFLRDENIGFFEIQASMARVQSRLDDDAPP